MQAGCLFFQLQNFTSDWLRFWRFTAGRVNQPNL